MENSNESPIELITLANKSETNDIEKDCTEFNEILKKKPQYNTSTRFVNAFTNVGYATSKKIADFTSNIVI
jgi:hypothetical protein